jgi:hypothetical protein
VISIGESEKVTIFFLRGGKRTFYGDSRNLEPVASRHPILETAGSVNWNYGDRNLYVVELNPKVFDSERRFFEANLHWIPGKACVYVGVTGLTPEERFRAHLRGEHSAWFVRKYGRARSPNSTNISTRFPTNWHSKWNPSWLGNYVPTASLSGKTNLTEGPSIRLRVCRELDEP